MRTIAISAACLLLAAPVFAQTAGDKAKELGEKTGVNSVIGAAPTTSDFATEAAQSDMFEVKASQLAAQKSDSTTKTFADEMVKDHTKTSQELKSMASTAKVILPPGLDEKHQKMLDDLSAKSGSDFTKTYIADQVDAHESAVSLFDRYAKNGDDPTLKAWAARTLPELQQHLQMAKALDKSTG
jgi:putative membrane protein